MADYSTDEFNTERFHLHGRVSLSFLDEHIVKYTAKGPFNEEMIAAVAKLLEEHIVPFKQHTPLWGEIVVFEESCMISDETLGIFEGLIQKLKAQNLTAAVAAFVFPEGIEGASLMPSRYAQAYEKIAMPFEVFKDEEAGLAWLKIMLPKVNA